MKKALLAGACAFAMSAAAMTPSFATEHNKSGATKNDTINSERHQTTGSSMSREQPGNAATTGSSMDSKRGVPGNDAVGGDASMSNPKSTAPGAAKAGGG